MTDGGYLFRLCQLEESNVTWVVTRLDHKFLVFSRAEDRLELVSDLEGIPATCTCRYSFADLRTVATEFLKDIAFFLELYKKVVQFILFYSYLVCMNIIF